MSVPSAVIATPVTHKRQLVSWLETGAKSRERWRIGTEHEKFVFDSKTRKPVPYDGENGIGVLLDELIAFKWQPVTENGILIGLKRGEEAISLEPGGQLELSGAPVTNLHQTAAELGHHLDEVGSVGRVLGLSTMGLGFHPSAKREQIPWMPKDRYKIMREYMPKVGQLGLDMMLRTCTVQVNLDFSDERDMVQKMRVSLALQPIATALFANSPFREGIPTGDLSHRMRIWHDTDPDRYHPLDFVFHPGFGFERYVDWALSVPMYFAIREGRYVNLTGASFLDFMEGKLEQLPGDVATLADWADHLTTLFPPVRLKRYIEMRGADMGSYEMTLALPALWTGLLYDSIALDEASELIADWSGQDRAQLHRAAPKLRLDSMVGLRSVRQIAKDMVDIAGRGLARRAVADMDILDESTYLEPLRTILERGSTQAEEWLRRYFDEWGQSVEPIFTAAALTGNPATP
jgi:glutamate--cysteine ligase